MEKITIHTEYIKLNAFLKLANIISNGSDVKEMLEMKRIKVNGVVAFERGKKLRNGDIVTIDDNNSYEVIEEK